MALVIKLKYIDALDDLPGGRKRFRRHWPKDVKKILGRKFMQRPMVAREGAALVAERETLLKEFDAMVAKHRRSQEERDRMTPRQLWGEAQEEAERLTQGIVGDVEGAMDVLSEEAQRKEDQLLYRAIKTPEAEKPKPTLADAFDLYAELKIDENAEDRGPRNRLRRVRGRMEKALGKLNRLPMAELKRAHGRDVLRAYMSETKSTGEPLSAGAIEREIDMAAAITELALLEFDLAALVANPFSKLDTKKPGDAPVVEKDKRLPLAMAYGSSPWKAFKAVRTQR